MSGRPEMLVGQGLAGLPPPEKLGRNSDSAAVPASSWKSRPNHPHALEKRLKKVALAEIKDHLSKFLHDAEREEILITRHGKPIIGSPKARPTPSSSNSRGRGITLAAA